MYIDNGHVSADVRTVNKRWKQLGLVLSVPASTVVGEFVDLQVNTPAK